MGPQSGKLQWEVISSPVEASSYQQAPRRGDPTHQDRQHHGFQFFTSLVFFSCVSVFLSSFIRKCFVAEVAGGGVGGDDHSAFSSRAFSTTNRLCSFNKACAGVSDSSCFLFFCFLETDVTIFKWSGVLSQCYYSILSGANIPLDYKRHCEKKGSCLTSSNQTHTSSMKQSNL